MRYLMDFVIDPKENAAHQVVSVLDRECRRLARWNSDQDGLGVFKMTLSDSDGDSIGRTSLGDSHSEVEPVEHSVDLDILAQTIADHINAGFRDSMGPTGYDFAQDILDALKIEFMDQSVHMREDEPVAEGTYAPDVLECLKWAATFAEGSRDGRGSNLDNPRFNRWIDDCNRAIAKAEKGGGYGGE